MGPPNTENEDFEMNKELIHNLVQQDGKLVSPCDLTMDITKPIMLEKLRWVNLDDAPVKMKLTNSGETVIISGKWAPERPYLSGGPLDGSYVFSQIHFHWGSDEHEGSEHTVRGICYPMEVHVVFYKTRYLTQEAALTHDDGIVIVVYLVKLQEKSAQGFQWLAGYLDKVVEPQTSTVLPLTPLSALFIPFTKDYLLYWGSLVTHKCSHTMLWFVSRSALSISVENLNVFRKLLNSRKEPMNKNFRGASPSQGRAIFHVNPSRDVKHLLHQGAVNPPGECYIINFSKMPPLDLVQAQKIFNRGDSTDEDSQNSVSEINKSPKGNKTKSSSKTYIFCEGTERDEVTNVANKIECESSAERMISNESFLSSSSPHRIASYHYLGDERLHWTKSQKRRSVISRKVLEKERRQEVETNKRRVSNKNEDNSELNGKPEKRLGRSSRSSSKKHLLTKTGQPYSIQKRNDWRSGKYCSQPQMQNKTQEEQETEVCLHYNMSQLSSGLSNESPPIENLVIKEDIPQETQGISDKENVLKKEKPRSRLPVSSKAVLKSSLAQYFSRPETAPQGQKAEVVKPSDNITKLPTPLISTNNTKRPITSTIPRPVGRNSGKLEEPLKINELRKSVSSSIKPVAQKHNSANTNS